MTRRRWHWIVSKRVPVLPRVLRANVSRSGVSWTWHLGRLASWNSRTGDVRINTPGPGGIVRRGTRRRRR